MSSSFRRFHAAAFSTLAFAALMTGCQTAPTPTASTSQGQVLMVQNKPAAMIRFDIAGFKAAERQLLSIDSTVETAITHYRVRVMGPDFEEIVSTPVAKASLASLSVAVPVGKNRLFTLEALEDVNSDPTDNPVIHGRLRSLGEVAGAGGTITLDYATDAAGRVLEALIERLQGEVTLNGGLFDFGSAGAVLTNPSEYANISNQILTTTPSGDLSALLKAYVNSVTGWNAGTGSYTRVNPVEFRAATLANYLLSDWSNGLTVLSGNRLLPMLAKGSAGEVYFELSVPSAGTYAVTLFDPFSSTSGPSARVRQTSEFSFTAGSSGEQVNFFFEDVPPGTWSLHVTNGTTVTQYGLIKVPEMTETIATADYRTSVGALNALNVIYPINFFGPNPIPTPITP